MKSLLLLLLATTACSRITEHEWERTYEPASATLDTTVIERPLENTVQPTQAPRATLQKSGSGSVTFTETSQENSISESVASTNTTRSLNSTSPFHALLFCYECPPQFLRLGNGCYYFSKRMETWTMAHFECRTRDSQLAVMDSAWEDRVIRGHLSRRAMTRLNRWIGGIYDWNQEQWVWGSSGEYSSGCGGVQVSTAVGVGEFRGGDELPGFPEAEHHQQTMAVCVHGSGALLPLEPHQVHQHHALHL
ncbi:C-type lectin fold [Trinorchestia longiramus]|nr:C-type lectin fold [Trinorchestia longiramus]